MPFDRLIPLSFGLQQSQPFRRDKNKMTQIKKMKNIKPKIKPMIKLFFELPWFGYCDDVATGDPVVKVCDRELVVLVNDCVLWNEGVPSVVFVALCWRTRCEIVNNPGMDDKFDTKAECLTVIVWGVDWSRLNIEKMGKHWLELPAFWIFERSNSEELLSIWILMTIGLDGIAP
jgi:hypothetical protein